MIEEMQLLLSLIDVTVSISVAGPRLRKIRTSHRDSYAKEVSHVHQRQPAEAKSELQLPAAVCNVGRCCGMLGTP